MDAQALAQSAQAVKSLASPALQRVASNIMLKLASLKIEAYFHHHVSGPIVDSYFFSLGPTVVLSKILGKDEDIAFAVGADSALIIRERSLISIQVAKEKRDLVDFNTALFKLAPSLLKAELPILLGQRANGEYTFIDLASEPHCLIAGSTGSGKSMFLLSCLCSLAVSKTPDELELYVVDTKQLDLAITADLPHIRSVCRTAKQFSALLDHLMEEMRKRNANFSGVARNLEEYNSIMGSSGGQKLARIAVVIDEFADVIEQDSSIADRVSSLAQLCRASGIHIILATQRPTVKVVPGNLKVNLPCRIAFKLPASVDSKVILNEVGAERLLGAGDMLVKLNSSDKLARVHAPFVKISDLSAILANPNGVRSTLLMVAAHADFVPALEIA